MYYEIFSSSTPKLFTPNDIPIDIKSFFLSQQPTMQGEKMNIQPLYDATVIVNRLEICVEIISGVNEKSLAEMKAYFADLPNKGVKIYEKSALSPFKCYISNPLTSDRPKIGEQIAKMLEGNGLKVTRLKANPECWTESDPPLIACDNFCD